MTGHLRLENVCTLPLSGDFFTQALHPHEPLLAVGLASGHVECFRLPGAERGNSYNDEDGTDSADLSIMSDGRDTIDSTWRTRRHKGSCRALGFNHDGSALYSAGTDGLIKHFSAQTGQVISKALVPSPSTTAPDDPTLVHVLSPQTLIVACDSGSLHLYDLRDHSLATSPRPQQTHVPHSDYVSSISPLPPSDNSTGGLSKQWVSTGGTTLAVTDLRRGVLVRSDDQEDELLSSVFMSGLGPKKNRNNGIVAVGSGSGVLTLWDRGAWDDQTDRVVVDREGESLDCMSVVPESVALGKKKVAVGLGNGLIRIVDLAKREVESSFGLLHDDIEAVAGIGFDCMGRMISGGGQTIKVWEQGLEWGTSGAENGDVDDEEDEDEDMDEDEGGVSLKKEEANDSDDDDDNGGNDDEDDDEKDTQEINAKRAVARGESGSDSDEQTRKRGRKKRRRGKGPADLGPYGAHGIMKIKGLS